MTTDIDRAMTADLIAAAQACATRSTEGLVRDHPGRLAFADFLEDRGVSWAFDWTQLDPVMVAEAVCAGVRRYLEESADQASLGRLDRLLSRLRGQMVFDL